MYVLHTGDVARTFIKEITNLNYEYPLTSFPSAIAAADLPPNVAIAEPLMQPAFTIFQNLVAVDPAYNETLSRWEYGWVVTEKTSEEKSAILATQKVNKNNYINTARLTANQQAFTHDGKSFAIDPLSRSDIDWVNGYVGTQGTLPPGWLGAWKAVDNSYYPIPDVATWNAFYLSIGIAGNANFAKAQALKTQLAAIVNPATAQAELDAIVW